MYLELAALIIRSSHLVSKYGSGIIPLFNALRSVQRRTDPSFFNIQTIGAAYELTLFSIFPTSNNSWICLSISSFNRSGTRYGLLNTGVYPSTKFILCSKMLHVPG